jgi:truncated putative phage structural protein|nr:MAG TPA: Receptor Binding Protein [Caudoviricetes sp.]
MISYPFISKTTPSDPYGDRAIDHKLEREFNKLCWSNGVFVTKNDGSELQVIAEGNMTVSILPGGCHIEGARGYEASKRNISISAAHSSLKRIDRIIARMDDSDSVRSIEIYKKEGVSSTTPTAPELVRESNYYEIALADIYVMPGATEITNTNIVDTRLDRELCGMVIPAFPTPLNLESISNQYVSLLQAAVSGTAAGNLQNKIDKLRTDVSNANISMTDVHINNTSLESELVAYFGSSIRV